MKSRHNMTVIDLFCGAGGLSEGFRQADFHVLAGQDYDDRAGETFSATHPEAKFIGGPIQDVTAQQLLKAAGVKKGEIDVIVGGLRARAIRFIITSEASMTHAQACFASIFGS